MWKHFLSGGPAAVVVLCANLFGHSPPAAVPGPITTVGPGSCIADCHCPPLNTCSTEQVALSVSEVSGSFWRSCAVVSLFLNFICLVVGKLTYPFTVSGFRASWTVHLPVLASTASASPCVDLLDFDSASDLAPLAVELTTKAKFAAAAKAQLANVLARRRDGSTR